MKKRKFDTITNDVDGVTGDFQDASNEGVDFHPYPPPSLDYTLELMTLRLGEGTGNEGRMGREEKMRWFKLALLGGMMGQYPINGDGDGDNSREGWREAIERKGGWEVWRGRLSGDGALGTVLDLLKPTG